MQPSTSVDIDFTLLKLFQKFLEECLQVSISMFYKVSDLSLFALGFEKFTDEVFATL